MDILGQYKLESNYYLYNCNQTYDLENNIGEIEIPEFTMEHISMIDKHYKTYMSQVNEIIYDDNEICVNQLSDIFELTELFLEHVDNIEELTHLMNKYNSQLTVDGKTNDYTSIRTDKIRMYLKEIQPIIKNDEDNLKLVLILLSNQY